MLVTCLSQDIFDEDDSGLETEEGGIDPYSEHDGRSSVLHVSIKRQASSAREPQTDSDGGMDTAMDNAVDADADADADAEVAMQGGAL